MALIESGEEMNAISSYLIGQAPDAKKWYWISGNDLAVTSQFMSITNGMPLLYFNWSHGQPDFPGKEQCIHLWLADGTLKMNNRECKQNAYYICQKQTVELLKINC